MIFWRKKILILSDIVEVYLWWKLQASLIFLSRRTCTIGGRLNTFLPHCIWLVKNVTLKKITWFVHMFNHMSRNHMNSLIVFRGVHLERYRLLCYMRAFYVFRDRRWNCKLSGIGTIRTGAHHQCNEIMQMLCVSFVLILSFCQCHYSLKYFPPFTSLQHVVCFHTTRFIIIEKA